MVYEAVPQPSKLMRRVQLSLSAPFMVLEGEVVQPRACEALVREFKSLLPPHFGGKVVKLFTSTDAVEMRSLGEQLIKAADKQQASEAAVREAVSDLALAANTLKNLLK